MGKPITTTSAGICFAFPDVCLTPPPAPIGPIPIPYPNIGQLSDATNASTDVQCGGKPVIHKRSQIPTTMGDEAGTLGATKGKVEFTSASATVLVNGYGVVRMFDTTTQNNGNAVGTVLAGVPTVLVGD